MIRILAAGLVAFSMLGATIAQAEDEHWENLTFDKLDDVATSALRQAQSLSFRNDREYCGYIAFDGNDRLRFTAPLQGTSDSCLTPEVPGDWELVASYHTHGSLAQSGSDESFELPSGDDLRGDLDEGIDGYLSTPGGRFWFIDTIDKHVFMVGDVGYFSKDPKFVQDKDCGPWQDHTFKEIYRMEREGIGACDL